MIKTQLIAVSVVSKVLAGSSLTAVLLECWQQHATLSGQQKGAIQDFSYGVLRFYGQLSEILAILLSKPPQDKKIYYLLLISLYQLLYSKLPAYTIVNQAVAASRTLTRSIKIQGLVNAVLRNFIRQKEMLLTKAAEKEVGLYSHPQWWIDKLRAQYPHHFHAVLNADNKRPPMTLRVNQSKINIAAYQQLLANSGMESRLIWPEALMLNKPVGVEKLPGFNDGLVSIQDAGAQLAAPLLDVQQGMRVLDACAAPGGKSGHLLELADISLTVLDNNKSRLIQVKQNLERLQKRAACIVCADAAHPDVWWDGKLFDRILADVPCSSSGVVCRHPDIKWLRRESDLQKFSVQQQAILHALWQILARNGKLLYATCSIFPEENKLLIKQFLQQHSDARIEPLSEPKIQDGQLLPDIQHDGFFYTRLHKR
ncbi:16S rRNA (cytosine(967)-C(5))-methyltransferase RsmB [Nitrosomonas aestuarii]|uniref:16S rRNA (cytosine(967)-C(5))-methyltransferase RsmB n=1 Tax=Nitrosomonas aestuarii TaxID=52441 RepID=UPI000D321A2B|nr:16S rRNA (cytosine(967)-C(5))-methyltransferase RsmB [Nitrosomonas aestuarii]PTN09430.1 16S rRNA (cytosine967-C5)-methyltransferase [Nitrosomonas aestuarii]